MLLNFEKRALFYKINENEYVKGHKIEKCNYRLAIAVYLPMYNFDKITPNQLYIKLRVGVNRVNIVPY